MDISREDHLRSLSRTGDNRLDLMRREVLGLIDDTISLGQATTPDKGQRLDHQLVDLLHIVDLTDIGSTRGKLRLAHVLVIG